MANHPSDEGTHGYVEDLEPLSPVVDYGLKNGDGFDPSRYDFYNPASGTAGKAFVVHLEEKQLPTYSPSKDSCPQYRPFLDPFDEDSPPPLSPIEELDDDSSVVSPRRSSDPGLPLPVLAETSKPDSFSLAQPEVEDDRAQTPGALEPLEQRCELLFSRQHLHLILADQKLSFKFTEFLRIYRPDSVPILAYYLDAVKALKTIQYAESIINGLEPIPGHDFTSEANSATMAWVMEDKSDRALDILLKDDFPAFIAFIYVQTVDVALVDRITGREDPKSRGIADGLAEVFVLSDPARPDNPIVFTSEEFHRMTGYPRNEFLGRNCRTLGGPRTSAFGISRFRESLDVEREHCEVLLNYRKDGTPFVNLIMCVPLRDQSGKVRYYLGAQLDITDLVNESTGFTSLKRLMRRHENHGSLIKVSDDPVETIQQNEFEQLSETFNPQELERLVKLRQRQQLESEHKGVVKESEGQREAFLSSRTPLASLDNTFQLHGEGSAPPLGYYKTYLLVRPFPSLRILFASPDLRMPGILQSPLLSKIGGSTRVRDELAHALEVGRKVTAKVKWKSKSTPGSRARWIHCTPLLGVNDAIGVWMVILVEDEDEGESDPEPAAPAQLSSSNPDSSHTAQAILWDPESDENRFTGISTRSWSDGVPRNHRPEEPKSQARKPLFRQPSDSGESKQSHFMSRPGPTIAGKAYSFGSTNDGRMSADDGCSVRENEIRPTSSSSTAIPLQSSMQPKVKIAGQPSVDGDRAHKMPIHMPYRPSVDGDENGMSRPPARRTYKSLSPYGVLFQD